MTTTELNIFPISSMKNPDQTKPNPTFTQLELNTKLIFKYSEPKQNRTLIIKEPNRTRTQDAGLFFPSLVTMRYQCPTTSSAKHDGPVLPPAVHASSVVDASTFKTGVKNQNKSSTAVEADFEVETKYSNN